MKTITMFFILALAAPAVTAGGYFDYTRVPYYFIYDGDQSAVVRSMTHKDVFLSITYEDEYMKCEPAINLITFIPGVGEDTPSGTISNMKIRIDRGEVVTGTGVMTYAENQEFITMPVSVKVERELKYGREIRTSKPTVMGTRQQDAFSLKNSATVMGVARKDCLREMSRRKQQENEWFPEDQSAQPSYKKRPDDVEVFW